MLTNYLTHYQNSCDNIIICTTHHCHMAGIRNMMMMMMMMTMTMTMMMAFPIFSTALLSVCLPCVHVCIMLYMCLFLWLCVCVCVCFVPHFGSDYIIIPPSAFSCP